MRKLHTLILLSLLVLAACGQKQEPVAATAAQDDMAPWAEFVDATIKEYYKRNPESAVDAGLHEYDGMLSDPSIAAAYAYADWIDGVIEAAGKYQDLESIEAFERDYLLQALRGQRWWIRETDRMKKNPMGLMGVLGFGIYVDREYAPIEERIVAYTKYMKQVPEALATAKANLEPPFPAPYVEIGHGMMAGLVGYLSDTVPGLFAAVEDETLQKEFKAANDAVIIAVQETADWLEAQKADATDDYALGEEKFLEMLRETEGVDVTLAELKAAGAADLQRNLDMLNAACSKFAPDLSVADCVLKVQNRKPPEGPVGGAMRQLPMLREFVEEKQLVTIPGTEDALVAEAPPHKRFNLAYINIPGPFEKGLPSTYYIAPPDPEWSEEDKLAYMSGETDLLAVSVHEVWPGHFLHYLHANRTENRIGRHFGTYTFSEGWAHYTEQMMWDAGLGDGDPEVHIGQLLNALLRNVRYMSAIGLHAEGMTVEESHKMFEEMAFQDFGNASQQASRGTYDPGYLNYTLGKLMINKLRDDWTEGRGGEEGWGSYHDQFLSYGTPPIPLVRKRMLGDDYSGDDALLP
ncbi:MAG: DUF885 domain-containing protein [Woeseiaceae bacterium]